MISTLILTFNEEVNIADCIGSLPWREDVNVLDSHSVDGTTGKALACGAKVHVREFTNYAEQRNHGLSLPFEHEWIVCLDADERMTPELAREIEIALAGADPAVTMFSVRRKDMFMGRWLRRSSGYPTWFPRVFRKGHVRVERDVNEEYVTSGKTGHLKGHILHHPFDKGMDWWFERHNRYSTMEAHRLQQERLDRPLRVADLSSTNPAARRAALKQIAYRLPGRPFLAFIYLYVIRLGFLDGGAGYHYALMRMAYEVMIDAKMTNSSEA